MIIAILGRQPKLGLAELESLYGAERVQPLGEHAAQVDADEVDFSRLGGAIKLAKPVTTLPTTKWSDLFRHVAEYVPEHLVRLPEGKIKLGFSVYGIQTSTQHLFRAGLELKKACRAIGRSVRIVPNTALELNSAQVIHNQLTSELGMELLFINAGDHTVVARTTAVQDVDDYAKRDFGRPKRDAFVGMLPPKLAQTMVNLAVDHSDDPERLPIRPARILDPFCGTGVVLQEALLMSYSAYGSDINEKMVTYSRHNLEWLKTTYKLDAAMFTLEVADATNHHWEPPFDYVVCEGYLGQPMSQEPPREKLQAVMHECNTIMQGFLKNIGAQLKPGTRLCIGSPAWFVQNKIHHLPVLDDLESLGYNRIDFKHVSLKDLVYHRTDQIVGRELVVLIKE
ncbi:MAG: TRM11 family SAM-dependent methyltransferase [Candidatus Saccharimonadales bacterium]